jgi:pyruvate dehydrogenase E2 component (dihydrolipoamide acetyltransferase)
VSELVVTEPGQADEGVAFFPLGGEGPPALLLHGFGSDHLLWLANQQALASIVAVAAVDLPGHGDSSLDVGEGTIAALAARLEASLDRRGLKKVHLIGHSLGGGLALVMAERRPDLVASLALIAPAGLGRSVDVDFLEEFPRLATPEAAIALLQRLVVRPRLINKFLVARVLEQLARPGAREALERIAQGIVAGEDMFAGALAAAQGRGLPRLAIWGKADAISPLSEERLDQFGGEVLFVEEASHLPHVEQPRLVNERISEFLARQIAR